MDLEMVLDTGYVAEAHVISATVWLGPLTLTDGDLAPINTYFPNFLVIVSSSLGPVHDGTQQLGLDR
jgi:hypothetical protein